MKELKRPQVMRLPIVERGWRIFLMYAIGVVLLFCTPRLPPPLGLLAIPLVLVAWLVLGSVRLHFVAEGVDVRTAGLLGRARHIPYASILQVELVETFWSVSLVISQRDGTVTEIGPWKSYWKVLHRRRIEAARDAIEAGVTRSRE